MPSSLDSIHCGITSFFHSFAKMSSVAFVYGMSHLDALTSLLDFIRPKSILFPRGFIRAGTTLIAYGMTRLTSKLLILDLVSLGNSYSMRSHAHPSVFAPFYGMVSTELLPFVLNHMHFDSITTARSHV